MSEELKRIVFNISSATFKSSRWLLN